MALGKSNLAISGCEVIAVYNLLQSYSGRDFAVSLPTLIEIFEKDGILRAGHFGVSPKAIAEYLKGIGLPSKTIPRILPTLMFWDITAITSY